MINIFIGFDTNEEVAYHVLSASIIKRASKPVSITPISLNSLKSIFNRKRNILESTEFSFSRFLVPYLSDYQGWSIFMDCDMLMLDDIAKLWELRDDKYALMCVHHNHVPDKDSKFLKKIPHVSLNLNIWGALVIPEESLVITLIVISLLHFSTQLFANN